MDSYLYVILAGSLLQLWIIYNIIVLSGRITEAIDTLTIVTVDLVRNGTLDDPKYKYVSEYIDKVDKL